MSEMGSSGEASEILSWKFTKDIFKEGKGNLLIEKSIKIGEMSYCVRLFHPLLMFFL